MNETFVFYYNPESEIETITRKVTNSDEKYFSIGHFVYDQNNEKYLIAGMVFFDDGNIYQGYYHGSTRIYYRFIYLDGDSFEGKKEWITNNDGTESFYKQGVSKCLNGKLHEGSTINDLWNGKVNFKWESGNKGTSEMLNNKIHGPTIFYDFDGKVKMDYFANDEEIFLP